MRDPAFEQFLYADDAHALINTPVDVIGIVGRASDADLYEAMWIYKPFLDCAGKGVP